MWKSRQLVTHWKSRTSLTPSPVIPPVPGGIPNAPSSLPPPAQQVTPPSTVPSPTLPRQGSLNVQLHSPHPYSISSASSTLPPTGHPQWPAPLSPCRASLCYPLSSEHACCLEVQVLQSFVSIIFPHTTFPSLLPWFFLSRKCGGCIIDVSTGEEHPRHNSLHFDQ